MCPYILCLVIALRRRICGPCADADTRSCKIQNIPDTMYGGIISNHAFLSTY